MDIIIGNVGRIILHYLIFLPQYIRHYDMIVSVNINYFNAFNFRSIVLKQIQIKP